MVGSFDTVCSSLLNLVYFVPVSVWRSSGALRVGELFPPSRHKFGGLLEDEVLLAICLWIRRSKTDTLGGGIGSP